jgi:hypothetical protein
MGATPSHQNIAGYGSAGMLRMQARRGSDDSRVVGPVTQRRLAIRIGPRSLETAGYPVSPSVIGVHDALNQTVPIFSGCRRGCTQLCCTTAPAPTSIRFISGLYCWSSLSFHLGRGLRALRLRTNDRIVAAIASATRVGSKPRIPLSHGSNLRYGS